MDPVAPSCPAASASEPVHTAKRARTSGNAEGSSDGSPASNAAGDAAEGNADDGVCLPSPADAPSEADLAIAARVLQYFSNSSNGIRDLQATATPAARVIRKSSMALAAQADREATAIATERARQRSERANETILASRLTKFKEMDRQRKEKVQLRVMRQEALSKLIEPQPLIDFAADGLLAGPADAPALTHDADATGADADAATGDGAAPSAGGKKGKRQQPKKTDESGEAAESRAAIRRLNMESSDNATSGVPLVMPAHSIGETGRGYRAAEPSLVPTAPQLKYDDGAAPAPAADPAAAAAAAALAAAASAATAPAAATAATAAAAIDSQKKKGGANSKAAPAGASDAVSLGQSPESIELDKSYLSEDALAGLPDAGDFSWMFQPITCYVCKRQFAWMHRHYDKLCPPCARLNWAKRLQMADLRGYTAVLTGARVKIGFECGLKLLRCGARVVATSRFPHDTAKRYSELPDFPEWRDRLHVHGLDMRDLKAVVAFTELVKSVYGRIDILVNNAAQTVRRPPAYYRHLLEDELRPRETLPEQFKDVVKEDAHSFYAGFKTAVQKQRTDAAAAAAAAEAAAPAAAAAAATAAAGAGTGAISSTATVEDVTHEDGEDKAGVFVVDAVTETISLAVGAGAGASAAVAAAAAAAVGAEAAASPSAVEEPAGEYGSAASVDAAIMASVTDAMLGDGKTLPPLSMAARSAAMADDASAAATVGGAVVAAAGAGEASHANAALTEALKETDNKAALLSQLKVVGGQDAEADMARYFPTGLVDVTGQQIDLRPVNSWVLTMSAVDPGELVETFAINALAPFILNSRLLPCMQEQRPSKPRFVINVSAMEGKFYRHKGPQHPHTNMAKAALNMMTRTSAQECVRHCIYMNSVDTGWINDENPYEKAQRLAKSTMFHTPIDEIDAMARILDPILDAVNTGKAVWGKFLKDFQSTEW
jgi:NAD(P)-dependent dehydrogenase (short-subunit alcohol dehydrogenase family)